MAALKEHGLGFKAPMVRAILAGTKTQTRRGVLGATGAFWDHAAWRPVLSPDGSGIVEWATDGGTAPGPQPKAPHGPVGRRLWVRETYGLRSHTDFTDWYSKSIKGWRGPGLRAVDYRADYGCNQEGCFWRPSIHMPRWASRITLEVTRVRVERVGDITPADALAEGFADFPREPPDEDPREVVYQQGVPGALARDRFADLWDSINGAGSWAASPWVWVYDFLRVG